MAETAGQGPARDGEGALGVDIGTTGGEWVFKQDGMLFGPAPARLLLDKLYSGEINGDTQIAEEGAEFRRLRDVGFFVLHVAKAEAKLRVDGEAAHHERGEKTRSKVKLIVTGTLALLVASGVAYGVYWAVASRTFEEKQEELEDIAIEIGTPLIEIAAATPRPGQDEELLDYVDADPKGGPRPASAVGRPPGATARAGKPPGAAATPPGGPAGTPPAKAFDEENITTASYDQNAINRVVKSSQGQLFPCLKDQALRDSTFRGDVPFTFTIDNDGRVGKLWLDKPGYKSGPLFDCMKAKLAAWKFPTFEGERPSVSLSFKVGK